MEFIPTAMLLALVWKFVDFLKALTNKQTNTAVTQLVVWAGGIAAVFLAGASQFAPEINVGTHTLEALDGATKLFVGLMIGSATSAAFDVKKALDGSDSAAQPKLLP